MICKKCKEDKGTDFRKHRKVCRECDNATAREYTKKLKECKKPDSIICKVCGEEKTEFRINRKKCLDCEREYGRKYRKETDKAKIWAEKNKERMTELQRNWYKKEKHNICKKVTQRYKNEPIFRLCKNHRNSIFRLINGSKRSKYVNCSGVRLRNWVQFQFSDNMNFENYGTVWVIDHVIPINTVLSGEYPPEIVLNWINIKPVPKTKNLTKNKYIDKDQCIEHLENIKHYMKIRKLEEDREYTDILVAFCETPCCGNALSTVVHDLN